MMVTRMILNSQANRKGGRRSSTPGKFTPFKAVSYVGEKSKSENLIFGFWFSDKKKLKSSSYVDLKI